MMIRSARVKHLVEVFEDLSDVTRNELRANNRLPFNLLHEMRQMLFRVGAVTKAVSLGGDTLFILAHEAHPILRDTRMTTFIAAQAYFDMGPAGVRLGRRYLKTLQRDWPGVTFLSATKSPHPDAARWFTLLGFSVVEKDVYALLPANIDKAQHLR
jgi:hypothetical protein